MSIEFQPETPILVKGVFISFALEHFTEKHSFRDDLVLELCMVPMLRN